MINIPSVKLGIVAVSRDCFPSSLSKARREAVVAACTKSGLSVYECPVIVENERDSIAALKDVKSAGVNALIVFLGNFGPEGPETILAQQFGGPVMFAAAAEERGDNMIDGRGDAYCGMLNASYNLALRGVRAYIPEYPVGTADDVADMIADFNVIARAYLGVKGLKIFGFGPRPQDFIACNAPIAPLYRLGVEVQENSELDLYESFLKHADDKRIPTIVKEMQDEMAGGCVKFPDVISSLAQYELTLTDWYEKNLGASSFGVFANKCWPAFQTMFHFVPCFINSRLASRGIPVACETDIYGALSEYILTCVTEEPVTLLDINNTVPRDMYDKNKSAFKDYAPRDLFMGFHCGNTPSCRLKSSTISYQLIMRRGLEPDSEPYFSRGTLEGNLAPSPVTLFRLQSTADTALTSYIAQGEVIDVPTGSFGAIGIIAVPQMGRFYRHVLIEKHFPHHAGVGFKSCGKYLYEVLKLLGVDDIGFNRPAGNLYPSENPFA
ncbi:MAG: L-fucose/L-arabinose isomerase family protein [Eubacteriales bacterium]